MGGRRSGAGTLRNGLAEGGLRLRIGDLVGDAPIARGSCRRGMVSWRNGHTGKGSGAVWFQIEVWEDHGTMRVRLALPDHATGRAAVHEQVIGLEAREMPRGGGIAWSFICPRTRHPCTVLHCPVGCTSFAGRRAFRLSYLSQRQSPRDRPLFRARKIRAALGDAAGNLTLPFPPRPKWMRRSTYERLRARGEAVEAASLTVHAAFLDRFAPGWRARAQAA